MLRLSNLNTHYGASHVLQGVDLHITLIGADPIAREIFKHAHELIGNVFYWVVGVHALAAIAQHFVLRDNTLRRMI